MDDTVLLLFANKINLRLYIEKLLSAYPNAFGSFCNFEIMSLKPGSFMNSFVFGLPSSFAKSCGSAKGFMSG